MHGFVPLLLFIWIVLAFRALPDRPDFSRISIWQPSHPRLVLVAFFIGVIGFYVRYYFPNPEEIDNWFYAFLIDLSPEMVGMAFTVVVIDELNQRRIEQQEKEQIIRQLGSVVNEAALESLRKIKASGWHKDGSLVGIDLWKANLKDANFQEANLEKADLRSANLEGTYFWGANLKGANLVYANFRKSYLGNANLQKANLWAGVNLEDADLSFCDLRNATLLEADLSKAKLHWTFLRGAKYTDKTTWPIDFDPKAAGAIKMIQEESGRYIPVDG
jgi:uncharacterized protein YjbI with pentapeptide repeats